MELRVPVGIAQMIKGDKEKCPKGGWPEYMNGEWYKQRFGRDQGEYMTEENAGKYGWGATKDKPYRFTTVEQKLSNARQWYNQARTLKKRCVVHRGR